MGFVNVTGKGFGPNATLTVEITGANAVLGSRSEVVTDPGGTMQLLLAIPEDMPAGPSAVAVLDRERMTASAEFTVDSGPLLVAHRGGTADFPENTLLAIRESIRNGAQAMWLTVQVSRDGVPVLYRPQDLSTLTDGSGPVASKTADELERLNAGYAFDAPNHPYRIRPTYLPTLDAALKIIPADMPIFLDLKQTPRQIPALVTAVGDELTKGPTSLLRRTVVFSTDADATTAMAARYPTIRVAESRDVTRQRLLDIALAGVCSPAPPAPGVWVAFEYSRTLTVTERYTQGTGTTTLKARLWTARAEECIDPRDDVPTMAIAINDRDDYQQTVRLGIDAVLVDSPARARSWT